MNNIANVLKLFSQWLGWIINVVLSKDASKYDGNKKFYNKLTCSIEINVTISLLYNK